MTEATKNIYAKLEKRREKIVQKELKVVSEAISICRDAIVVKVKSRCQKKKKVYFIGNRKNQRIYSLQK